MLVGTRRASIQGSLALVGNLLGANLGRNKWSVWVPTSQVKKAGCRKRGSRQGHSILTLLRTLRRVAGAGCRTRVSGWVRGHCKGGRRREPGRWVAGGSRTEEERSHSHSDRVSGPDEGREGQADCVGALQKGIVPWALEGGTKLQENSWRPWEKSVQ